jgi:hypothetical protein
VDERLRYGDLDSRPSPGSDAFITLPVSHGVWKAAPSPIKCAKTAADDDDRGVTRGGGRGPANKKDAQATGEGRTQDKDKDKDKERMSLTDRSGQRTSSPCTGTWERRIIGRGSIPRIGLQKLDDLGMI